VILRVPDAGLRGFAGVKRPGRLGFTVR
jgi:hypothetical protein